MINSHNRTPSMLVHFAITIWETSSLYEHFTELNTNQVGSTPDIVDIQNCLDNYERGSIFNELDFKITEAEIAKAFTFF